MCPTITLLTALGAEAMTEARARVGPETSEAERVFSSVTDALGRVLQSSASPAERCAALEALIWAQVLPLMPLTSGNAEVDAQ